MNPLDDYKISKSITADVNAILNSNEIIEFRKGQEFKSPVNAKRDASLVDLLLTKANTYANGWKAANALKTAELFRLSQDYDEAIEELKKEVKKMNDLTNDLIKRWRDNGLVDSKRLDELRDLEIEFRKALSSGSKQLN